jgi:hypothetical protein
MNRSAFAILVVWTRSETIANLAVAASGDIYVADPFDSKIWKIIP